MKLRPALLAAFVPLLLSTPSAAQLLPPSPEPTQGIDDVVVVQGWRHPVQLRLQMVEAELAVYELFNQLNDDASLTLTCSRRNIGGTRLQGTDCAARFEADALAEEGRDALEQHRAYLNSVAITQGNFSTMFPGAQNVGTDPSMTGPENMGNGNTAPFMNYMPATTAPPAILAINAGQARLRRKMETLAMERPEFMEAVSAYVDAKSRYTRSLRRVGE